MPLPLNPGGARSFGATAAITLAVASLVASAAVGSVFLSTTRDTWAVIAAAGPAGPADGILLVAALGGVLLSLWLGLGLTLSALSALPGAVGQGCRWLAGRIAPAAVRKCVAFVLGTTLTAALAPGSAAAGTDHDAPRPSGVVAAATHVIGAVRGSPDAAPDPSFRLVSDPLHPTSDMEAAPPPSWPAESAVSPKPARPAVHKSPAGRIVVQRGDTLWSIAARHLDPVATAADIDAACQRWFAANREVIGDDANLILPGQLLSPPSSPSPPQENS